jgi:hypothetical protein
MESNKCPEYAALEDQVTEALQKLVDLIGAQLAAFRAREHGTFMRLDKELETAVGHKERVIGALRQHAKDHGCRP